MKTLGNILIILFIFASVYAFRNELAPVAQKIGTYVKDISFGLEGGNIPEISQETDLPKQKINTPGPLVVASPETSSHASGSASSAPSAGMPEGTITDESIIYWTNQARADNGNLPALKENATLDSTALLKANDLFAKQYFAHTSPTGMTVATQVTAAGYSYIEIGENLALGDFASGQAIVNAWMGSPGHRANILNTHYTDIGVAVEQGMYQGNLVWIAVQHFGWPASACPSIDATLKATIDANQTQIDTLSVQIDAEKSQIDANNDQAGLEYGEQINAYNALVEQYNALVATIKSQITTYNGEVDAYNQCASSA